MDAVKCGDVERLKKISLKKYQGNVGRLSDDPIKILDILQSAV